uniref:Uncharacterized protein n=1 Tax=Rhizophora mucronata TaxID=61149 RepID=A0A2P2J341_RHIMU
MLACLILSRQESLPPIAC